MFNDPLASVPVPAPHIVGVNLKKSDGTLETVSMFSVSCYGVPVSFPDSVHILVLVLPLIRAMAGDPRYQAELARLGFALKLEETADHDILAL